LVARGFTLHSPAVSAKVVGDFRPLDSFPTLPSCSTLREHKARMCTSVVNFGGSALERLATRLLTLCVFSGKSSCSFCVAFFMVPRRFGRA
jgi:hypothetical protein